MEEKRPFGEYIRRKRQEAGLTQKELAGRLFVTESCVSKWERDLSYPDVSLVTAICRELHISEHEFFTACDDDQAHAQERAEAVRRGAALAFRRLCLAGYLAAVPTCFICNLAVFHRLDWFWVVLAAVALGFCFTNLPWLVRRERAAVCLGAATLCLLLLLLACWRYVGGLPGAAREWGWWTGGGLAVTAVSLALPWGWWAVWRFYGKHVLPLCLALTSVWVFPLLAVIRVFTGGAWLNAGLPLAAMGVAFLWVYYLCLSRLRTGPWMKAGAFTLTTAFVSPAFSLLCRWLIPGAERPRALDCLIFAVLLLLALFLFWTGAKKEKQSQ